MDIDMNDILQKFNIRSRIEEYGNGHINDTYLTSSGNHILQRINTGIFKDPEKLMDNIDRVTAFLRKKIKQEGGDPQRGTLTVIKTLDGKNYYKVDDAHCYRVYNYVNDTITIDDSKDPEDLFSAGEGFGHFQKLLSDFPADELYETIVNFHNTPSRVEDLKTAVKEDKAGRAPEIKDEIDFALSCADFADKVVKGLEDGSIPLRVTHNDTKINNILFDKDTRKAICVIDLDTVMPGSALYDFGDALRMGASTAAEDEANLDIVNFDEKAFEGFAKGYLSEMKDSLTDAEISLLPFSAKLLTYECGIRFLTDYLNGDTYFKIHREKHNLDRARNQFKLVRDIEAKEEDLGKIVARLIAQ